jgi:predicted DCC family thiol-disulfide oxidoreductase YuxK
MQRVLSFDGRCKFCRMCVEFLRSLTGDTVEYKTFEEAGETDRDAVHYLRGETRYRAAHAIFQAVADVPGYGWPVRAYHHVPGFRTVSEALYKLVAAHRDAAYRVTRLLWGDRLVTPTYNIAALLFSKAIALIYLIAFVSLGLQWNGLIGSRGILPVTPFLNTVRDQLGGEAFWRVPTVFWWASSDVALQTVCWSCAALAIVASLLPAHRFLQRAAFALLLCGYLSFVSAGQIFMGYQWDYLLLEAGFLAIFLTPALPRVWLFRWLLFRLMFESGAVKLLSHDPTWKTLTALNYHYWTQPLPTRLAWYMAQAPEWFQKASTVVVFAIELIAPFLMLGPRRLRHLAAAATIGLQVLILLTGSYTFFNLLTIALCFFLWDDLLLARFIRIKPVVLRANRFASAALFLFVMVAGCAQLADMFGTASPGFIRSAMNRVSSFGLVNQYGLFASMTTSRVEISVEGSNDGVTWSAYTFRYKPGDLKRAPVLAEPHQPRLDWQMWFASLGNYQQNPWFTQFLLRLLQASPPVLDLLQHDPFGGRPPKYIRAVVYDYHFTDFEMRRKTGQWWTAQPKGMYFPPVSLRSP